MFNSKIAGFAKYIPEKVVTNDDLSKLVDTSDEWIFSRTGIRERRLAVFENTSYMCAEAAKTALLRADIRPEEVELIITATMTPDYASPSTACLVQKIIGAKNAVSFDLCAACTGFVFALSSADKFIKTGAFKNALVIGGEIISKITDWSDRGTCVLFGDGAGACVIKPGNGGGIIAEDLHSDGRKDQALTSTYAPVDNPYSKDGKEGFTKVKMDGREIFNFAVRKVPESIKTVLNKANLSIEDIKYIVPHQANSRIVEVIAKKLKIPMDKFYMNMDKYGNTSSASIPIALAEMSETGLIGEKDKLIISGFGGGLTWGSAVIEL